MSEDQLLCKIGELEAKNEHLQLEIMHLKNCLKEALDVIAKVIEEKRI